MRLFRWLFAPKPYGCGCGKWFRSEAGLQRCVWKHALNEDINQ